MSENEVECPFWWEEFEEGLVNMVYLIRETAFRLAGRPEELCAYPRVSGWRVNLAEKICWNCFQPLVDHLRNVDSASVRAAGFAQGFLMNGMFWLEDLAHGFDDVFDATDAERAETEVYKEEWKAALGGWILPAEFAVELPSPQRQEYFDGLSRGNRSGIDETGQLDSRLVNPDLHFALLIFWRSVSSRNSVKDLFDWLYRARVGFPEFDDVGLESEAAKRKQLENLCQEIGIRFRGRGRPRKS